MADSAWLSCNVVTGPEDYCQADPPGAQYRQGPLWRGVEGQVARGERGRQDLLHHGGGQLVQGDRTLPDSAAAT